MSTLTVAIVGRTNVGKSTLFNRLSSSVKSLTLNYSGVTRDVLRDAVEWHGKKFDLVDTGGISVRKSIDEIGEKVRQQALKTIEEANLILLVIDGATGIVEEDRKIASLLQSLNKRVLVIVNKIDRSETQEHVHEGFTLGYRDVFPISAQHGRGIDALLEKIIEVLPSPSTSPDTEPSYRVTLLGRPNVGKSSLMNALLKYERSIVSEQPGTTREAITEAITFYKEHLALTDTPGIRRKKAISTPLESLMIKSAFGALKETDIVVFLIDATLGALCNQDLKLAFYAFTEQYKALIILVNKYDAATPEQLEVLKHYLSAYKHLMSKVPLLYISCKTSKNIGKVLPLIQEVWKRSHIALTETELTSLFVSALSKRPLIRARQSLRLIRAYQVKQLPLTIVLEIDKPQLFEASHRSFFENLLRNAYNLVGVPVRLVIRGPRKTSTEL